jgi:hypothetical protein
MDWIPSWSPPLDPELWITLFYAASLLIGARIVEVIAQRHFARSQRHAEQGFEYIEGHDHYRCPEGRVLHLHSTQEDKRLAVYRAPAAHCRLCPLKAQCAPSTESRVVFRSLAVWAETSVGVFHRCVSIVMVAAAVCVCVAALWRWNGQAGSAWIASGVLVGLSLGIQRTHALLRTVRHA